MFVMTYGVEFRHHILSVQEKEGLTFAGTSERFFVGISSLTRWAKAVEAKATREGRPRKIDLEALARDVSDHPDAHQYGRSVRFGVTSKAIWQALRRLGVTYKKALCHRKTVCLPRED